jgi:hypothetical protein
MTGMRRFALFVVLAVASAPTLASAEVFKLYADVGGGGAYGKGIAGMYKDDAFFANAKGGAASFVVGGRFLIIDANVRHSQLINGGEIETWTQFNAGLNFGMDSGTEEEKKQFKGAYFEMGAGVAFGLGTGAQVMPPLDNSEVTDKGFMLEGRLGFGKHLGKIFDIGVSVPVSWGYFFKTGGGANEMDNQYQAVQVLGLLVLRANIRFI